MIGMDEFDHVLNEPTNDSFALVITQDTTQLRPVVIESSRKNYRNRVGLIRGKFKGNEVKWRQSRKVLQVPLVYEYDSREYKSTWAYKLVPGEYIGEIWHFPSKHGRVGIIGYIKIEVIQE